jgi:hypothetical protein
MVAASIASLKVTLMAVFELTAVAPSIGELDTTLGGVMSAVAKVNEKGVPIALPA